MGGLRIGEPNGGDIGGPSPTGTARECPTVGESIYSTGNFASKYHQGT